MSDRNPFADRERGQEEEYFHKRERELIEKMRERSAIEAKRQELYEAVRVTDPKVLEDLQELGYTRETVGLLHLLPLVRIAWAEGKITQAERALIFEAGRARGVEPGTPGYEKLTEWLNRRPSEKFFDKTMQVIQALLMALPEKEVESSKRDLLSYCTRVAEASGGILGLGRKIDRNERAVIEQVAKMLEQSHKSAAQEVLDQK
jgi:tellurite resistance protein